jgi:hypothetical protein
VAAENATPFRNRASLPPSQWIKLFRKLFHETASPQRRLGIAGFIAPMRTADGQCRLHGVLVCATGALPAGLKRIADNAGMESDDPRLALPILELRTRRSLKVPVRRWPGLSPP